MTPSPSAPATARGPQPAQTTLPPPTTQPPSRQLEREGTVNSCNTYGENCGDQAIYKSTPPPNFEPLTWTRVATVPNGARLVASCWADGGVVTNYVETSKVPDYGPNPYESSIHFSVRTSNGASGWIPDTSFARDKDTRMGLPGC